MVALEEELIESIFGPYSIILDPCRAIIKNKDKIISNLDERLNLGYKTKKVLEKNYGSGITLENNKLKDIKVVRSLENRGTLLKRTNNKIVVKKDNFSIFFEH